MCWVYGSSGFPGDAKNIPTGTAPLRADAASYKLQVGGPYHFHQCVGRAANYHEKIPSLIPSCVVLG